jgi:hypothetical protein
MRRPQGGRGDLRLQATEASGWRESLRSKCSMPRPPTSTSILRVACTSFSAFAPGPPPPPPSPVAPHLASLLAVCAYVCEFQAFVCVHMRKADGEDPDSLYSKQEIYHSWHDEDAIVVPSSCAHVLRGEERVKTVMWGRWQLRNESSGLFRSLSLGPLSFLARFRRVPPLPSVHLCMLFTDRKRR